MNLLFAVLASAMLGAASAAGSVTDETKSCFLLGRRDAMDSELYGQKKFQNAKKPFPSLTQCYKYNTEACCVSGHDKKIKDDYSGFLSDTCLREYQELEYYFCLGCHPSQHKYTTIYDTSGADNCVAGVDDKCKFKNTLCPTASNNESKCIGHVRVCNSFAYRKLFPNCQGLTVPGDAKKTEAACKDTTGTGPNCCYDTDAKTCINGVVKSTGGNMACKTNGQSDPANEEELFKAHSVYDNCAMSISDESWSPRLPSYWINNTGAFLNKVKPPFFENFHIEIVPDAAAGGDATLECFTNGGAKVQAVSLVAVLSTLFAFVSLMN